MKFLKYLLLSFIACVSLSAANAQYKGGSNDGFDAIGIIQLSNTNVAYMGGAADGFAIASTDPVLPVMFSRFTAIYQKQSNAVQLEWQTATEQNTDYFLAEISTDNHDWNTIQKVMASGNSNSVKTYYATHNNPLTGKNFYRIVTVDKDGQKNVSAIRIINLSSKSDFAVINYNNPVTDVLKLHIQVQHAGTYQFRILQADGRQIINQSFKLSGGNSLIPIEFSGNAAGVYFISITDTNGTVLQTIRVIKQ